MTLWWEAVEGRHRPGLAAGSAVRVGALRGEGVGPEVMESATGVFAAACEVGGRRLELKHGPDPVGRGSSLTEEAAEFCRGTFASPFPRP